MKYKLSILLSTITLAWLPGFEGGNVQMKRLAPVLVVEEIEPCLPFWERLGYERTAEVPEGDKLGFVILKMDQVEVMYQSRASVEKDIPALAKDDYLSALFIEVAALDPVIEAAQGSEIVFPERTTFYGAREIGYREPGGNLVTFAEFENQQ